jgi:hypothetical protein
MLFAAGKLDALEGEPVESNADGRPVIARQLDEAMGKERTIVENEDGSRKVFGETTIASMLTAEQAKTFEFASSLTERQLRGFIHEIQMRLRDSTQLYSESAEEYADLLLRLDFKSFGLEPSASRKELDAAYRKLAKKMHPDKNGGTEEANERFQNMKVRYERLKEHLEKMGKAMATYISRVKARACARVWPTHTQVPSPAGTRRGEALDTKGTADTEMDLGAKRDVAEKRARDRMDIVKSLVSESIKVHRCLADLKDSIRIVSEVLEA